MQIKQTLRNGAAFVGSTLIGAAAFAQGDPFATAMTDITSKVTSYGGSLVGLSAVAVVFYVAIKFVKKIPKAA